MKTRILTLSFLITLNANAAPNREPSTITFKAPVIAQKKTNPPKRVTATDSSPQVTQIIANSYGMRLF